jgi:N-acetylglucosaminyldiphosphoundecaprenol N-acetyl-beta-D-mannosaminyltransferase
MTDVRGDCFGVGVNLLSREQALTRTLARIGVREGGAYVCFCNVHLIAEADEQAAVKSALNSSFLTLPDGLPLAWYLRWHGYDIHTNVRGADLMLAVCQAGAAKGARHVLYGGQPQVLDLLQVRLRQQIPDLTIVDAISPPFRPLMAAEQSELIDRINRADADFVWVCLGAPRQELWMQQHGASIRVAAMFGVGAAFDFLAATKRPAPVWMQRVGLEWFFRFCQEPRRLWRRYLLTNSRFLWLVGRDMLRLRRRSGAQ